MKKYINIKTATALAVASIALFSITGCSITDKDLTVSKPDPAYTEQTARAIHDGAGLLAGALIAAAFIRGIMNK